MCSVDGIIVDEEVDEEADEVDNRTVGRGVFERVLLAGKSVMGLNKLCRPLRTLIASNL